MRRVYLPPSSADYRMNPFWKNKPSARRSYYPAHIAMVKRMADIKRQYASLPYSIMSDIKAVPMPPCRMIYAVPWTYAPSPPQKIRLVSKNGGRRAV
jgi:hypothetical protein